jgi:hypothetical protein
MSVTGVQNIWLTEINCFGSGAVSVRRVFVFTGSVAFQFLRAQSRRGGGFGCLLYSNSGSISWCFGLTVKVCAMGHVLFLSVWLFDSALLSSWWWWFLDIFQLTTVLLRLCLFLRCLVVAVWC